MSFLGLPAQDLGEDFEFESDSRSLGEILREEKAPSSRLQQISTANQKVKTAATLTPVRVKPPSKSLLGQDLELFQTKSGALFWRELENGKGSAKKRGLGRAINLLPKRITPKPTPSKFVVNNPQQAAPPMTERKDPSFHPPIHRQSISERKAVPHLDKNPLRRSFLPKPVAGPKKTTTARKELNFEQPDFEFAKPKAPPIPTHPQSVAKQKSLAMKIMMRESLAGMPRASLSGLLRQSLTMAELDRMFEDDSTESFENLESRLKTPAKKKRPAPTLASEPSQNSEASEDGLEKPLSTERLDIDPNESSVKTADKIESLNRDFEDCESNKEECEASVVADEEESTPTPSGGTEEAGHMSLYEIEINDEEDFELAENNASLLLQRARSYEDLVTTTEEQVVVPATSSSVEDLSNKSCSADSQPPPPPLALDTSDPFLRDAIERVNRHREEQIALDNKILEIMAKSKKRREDFRAVWGFSPKSINRKRSVKTVFNVHQIKMSEDAPEPDPADEGGEIQDIPPAIEEIASERPADFAPISENDKIFKEVSEDSEEDVKELDQSISTDLFMQVVEANLPEEDLHNFTGVNCTAMNATTFSMDELAQTLEADYKRSFEKANQASLETPEVNVPSPQEVEFQGPDENLEEVDMDLEDDLVFGRDEWGFVDSSKENLQPTQEIMAAPPNKGEKKKRKSVRFAESDPSSTEDIPSNFGMEVDAGKLKDSSENQTEVTVTPMIQIDIPVRVGTNSEPANISVNESRLCLTGAGLRQPRTPLPNRSKPVEMSAATPVALRDISFRAQRELASLYDDLED